MEERKTTRGRPKGSGIDDRQTLMKIAAIIAAEPNKKRTTAIKQIGINNPSHIRRLRDKFNEQADSLISSVKGGASKIKTNGSAISATPAPAAKKAATKKAAPRKAAVKATAKTAKKTAKAKKADEKARVRKSAPKPAAKEVVAKAAGKSPTKAAAKSTTRKAVTKSVRVQAKSAPVRKTRKTAAKRKNGKAGAIGSKAGLAKAGFKMGEMPWLNSGVESVVGGIVENQIALYESALKHSPMAAFLRQQALMIDMALSMLKAQQDWTGGRK